MSITFVCGKPRSGKSYWGMRFIARELQHGKRTIITNVPVREGVFREWLNSKPWWNSELSERLVMLTDEEVPSFYTVRPGGHRVANVDKALAKAGVKLKFSEAWCPGCLPGAEVAGVSPCHETGHADAQKLGGVCYVLDEAHVFWGSRTWHDTGTAMLWYLSQHGHLGDDVICITQHPAQVDKAFLRVTDEFIYITNLSRRRLLGFRGPSKMLWRSYPHLPSHLDKPSALGAFGLDQGLADCYSTARGVGMGEGQADMGSEKRGFPWWSGVAVFIFALSLFALIPSAFSRTMGRILGVKPPAPRVEPAAAPVPAVAVKASAEAVAAQGDGVPVVYVTNGAPGALPPRLPGVTSWYRLGTVAAFVIEDGRLLREPAARPVWRQGAVPELLGVQYGDEWLPWVENPSRRRAWEIETGRRAGRAVP